MCTHLLISGDRQSRTLGALSYLIQSSPSILPSLEFIDEYVFDLGMYVVAPL